MAKIQKKKNIQICSLTSLQPPINKEMTSLLLSFNGLQHNPNTSSPLFSLFFPNVVPQTRVCSDTLFSSSPSPLFLLSQGQSRTFSPPFFFSHPQSSQVLFLPFVHFCGRLCLCICFLLSNHRLTFWCCG